MIMTVGLRTDGFVSLQHSSKMFQNVQLRKPVIPKNVLVATILNLSVQQQVFRLGHPAKTVKRSSSVLQTNHVNLMEDVPDHTAQEEADVGVQNIKTSTANV